VLALAAALIAGAPGAGRAGQVQVIEQAPHNQTVFRGNIGLASVWRGQSYGPTSNHFVTADGHFAIDLHLSAANIGPLGIPNASLTATVTDVTGGAGSVFISDTQQFNGVFNAPVWGALYQMTGNFTEAAPFDGNGILGQGFVASAALLPLNAVDRVDGLRFSVPRTPMFGFVPRPTSLGADATFTFTAATRPGDSSDIPLTIRSSAVPEPGTFVMLGGMMTLTLAGYGWHRRRAARAA
jgi:hypothetical protein